MPNPTSSGSKFVEHGIANIETLIKFYAWYYNNGYIKQLPTVNPWNLGACIEATVNKTHMEIDTNNNFSAYTAYFEIYYTKTS